MKTLEERIVYAEMMAGKFLADANAAFEAKNYPKADFLYGRSQQWLDRYNKLAGNA